jgi:predicted RNA methylase
MSEKSGEMSENSGEMSNTSGKMSNTSRDMSNMSGKMNENKGLGVLDIGAGNANMGCLLHLLHGIPVFCVDRDPPPAVLRSELRLPLPHTVIRVEVAP